MIKQRQAGAARLGSTIARRQRFFSLLLVAVLLCASCGRLGEQGSDEPVSPNIILINLDDADLDLIGQEAISQHYPNIERHLQAGGIRLDNLHVADPLCGPSRASLFRGQYPHNTGIELNFESQDPDGPTGSWAEFLRRGYADQEIASWMKSQGYFTALTGKYHHTEYPAAAGYGTFVPPGWDEFRAALGGRYFETTRVVNGEREVTGPSDFRTDVEAADAVEIIKSFDPANPLFLYIAPLTPHSSSTTEIYAERHADRFSGMQVPRTPDFNEADYSDKPPELGTAPLLSEQQQDLMDESYRDRLRSMLSVDEMVGDIFAALESEGLDDNTYVMLTSDNGYQLGHHRLFAKKDPFDRTTRVGLLAAGPGITPGVTSDALLSHIDITATILDLANATQPEFLDGISFKPLLHDEPFDGDRIEILIENREPKSMFAQQYDTDYVALRFEDTIYVEWAEGGREYYDLAADPYQLENQFEQLPDSEKERLASRLDELRECRGGECHGEIGPAAVETVVTDLSVEGGVLMMSGTAEAAAGIDRVAIVLRGADADGDWNGSEFVVDSEAAPLEAELASDGGNVTWTFEAAIGARSVWVSARAVDEDGNEDEMVDGQFVVGQAIETFPSASINSLPETVEAGQIELSGNAVTTDDASVRSVMVRVSNIGVDFPTFWTPDGFIEETNTWHEATLSADGSTWSFDVGLAPGLYRAHAFAVDSADDVQTWDAGRPSIVFEAK